VEIVVRGRHIEVSDRFREHASEKIAKVERLDPKAQLVDVELCKEPNPRLADRSHRVEVTVRSRGPVVRAEAAADDKYAALDLAWSKLEARLRKLAERRRDRWTGKGARPVHVDGVEALPVALAATSAAVEEEPEVDRWEAPDLTPPIVREKLHEAPPMTLDDALEAMELVGHDFYLFVDATTGLPSVVYRRRGYDYGVIRLQRAAS
jgi:ribosomal subunit interface protein